MPWWPYSLAVCVIPIFFSAFGLPCLHICALLVLALHPFLGSGPKGPMFCRTQGGISRRQSVLPSFHPSFHPSPPPRPSEFLFCSLRPDFGPLSHQISPFKPQFSPNQLFGPHICPQDRKSALQTSNQPFRPQIKPSGLKFVL